MTMDRTELRRLHERAVGDGRRYYADSRVNALVTAVGEYLTQDDPTVEIAYLRATLVDVKAERDAARVGALQQAADDIDLSPYYPDGLQEGRTDDQRRPTLYIAGPMTGLPEYNFPAFFDAEQQLHKAGFDILNPADTGVHDGWEWSDYMRAAIAMLVRADGVALLDGWHRSRGAAVECKLACDLGMRVEPVGAWLVAP